MCDKTSTLNLKIVDGLALPEPFKSVLRPDELVRDPGGHLRRLPRFFFEVASWDEARELELAPGFCLWEFINVDVREAEPQRQFPRYVPCAVTLLAANLSVFRHKTGSYVHIAANGGYRSPGHALSTNVSTHMWGSAANVYRIGDDYLDSKEKIEKYRDLVHSVLPGAWTMPYGEDQGCTGDHLHLDLGYLSLVPHGAEGERASDQEADEE